jgi:hypothetical protein
LPKRFPSLVSFQNFTATSKEKWRKEKMLLFCPHLFMLRSNVDLPSVRYPVNFPDEDDSD